MAGPGLAGQSVLDFGVEDLPPTVHAITGVHAVGHECGAVRRVDGDLGCFEIVCAAAFAAAGLGLFAFWLSHGSSGKM